MYFFYSHVSHSVMLQVHHLKLDPMFSPTTFAFVDVTLDCTHPENVIYRFVVKEYPAQKVLATSTVCSQKNGHVVFERYV